MVESLEISLEEWRLPPDSFGSFGEIPPRVRETPPPPPAPGAEFLRGPIGFEWVARASRLPGSGLRVAVALRFLSGRSRRREPRWSVGRIAFRAGISSRATQTALRDLLEAGLVQQERRPGSASLWEILELSGRSGRERWPLWGPVPWRWWSLATRLPGKAAHVGLACWLRAGWERRARVEIPTAWGELGLSDRTMRRGLDSLARAGLVELARTRGRAPVVTLQDEPLEVRSQGDGE